ncbi:2,3,4,5-tetrahydropyridine-2,6-dicarboxylate N-succinyltransferase [Haliea sp.]|jgi:2,3,4,5-tetrahydropyridine-2-carboxylate N-succinyltransferase|uniref:2,3,4,5-tetrahydropyridine-2,6-dicarboxylate N-succinyltransferase n=1 Tax=Haliea TaxID=475794 RepID=UPI000C45AF6D|nr:2,3,4,5-tetrahydropyridine-2,6-dicarboxylate N-succinyltransferase [Haliea sp.]MAD62295.1 2,3,4,5-tetrahydropyridine-2,6-dicarboxylate N-succinyltransferase [Haliea sp.]MAY93700.1 2,3,4,5-tetrahydropyridine-2,6-dicarboxylate N-succinyltransferase [Haliea sp.]MBK41459.1 2,3,4,5-tetrahydropyridine-2,6-dicarboxylate N-succinyltransferase [Haliea sp.]MBP70682.1 2,3,4,5-tetrahydropyridine-2,6-dicarboxylate N-succinyltransferase [Haliea sp.]|tara:strand:- start:3580 stop:4599 length:1020 start_codon:yes stop_codon:yes gene_type:complete
MKHAAYALGLGLGTRNSNGDWLEVFFPNPVLSPSDELVAALGTSDNTTTLERERLLTLEAALAGAGETEQAQIAAHLASSHAPAVVVILREDAAPSTVPEAYLKLHLLSHRLVKPHGTNLQGLFAILPNVAWTSEGAIDISELPARQLAARLRGDTLEVSCVDKFPKMTNYVVPTGVRIAHTARVRLGAYLGEGTTIMHEGFVNFNAGTDGPGMIEGRISAGVMVGSGSDLGGGCSTMGTLSGGGNIIISVGSECLIGANAGIGIPLGDRCTVEAGLFVTAGTKVVVLDATGQPVETVKARELAGKSGLLFRRNSANGAVECLTNRSAIELNAELHAHN